MWWYYVKNRKLVELEKYLLFCFVGSNHFVPILHLSFWSSDLIPYLGLGFVIMGYKMFFITGIINEAAKFIKTIFDIIEGPSIYWDEQCL